jgi:glutathione S-transferase
MTTHFKLYYSPTSCGAANYLAASIGGLEFDSETVDLGKHQTKSGVDFYTINPKGNVPAIVFPDGALLNENVATLTFLADQGNAGLAPEEGTAERYAYLNDLGFVASELHPAFGALFNPKLTTETREAATANALRRVGKLVTMLDGGKKPYLNGKSLSSADLYAFIVLGWSGFLKVTLPSAAHGYVDGLRADARIQKAQAAMAAAQ